MTLLSILEIGILISFSAFFLFWCKEIKKMRTDINSISISINKAVNILEEINKVD